ncbi:MAG: glycosyltransferase [Clostridium sp.]|nr:glycosyltransferase [Clostridium sp.]MCM1398478.1 glycosyltransferase [Clostridium sp.]MCM1460200.1 glycosyltransferase [Bacteroides sp.]
MKIVHYFLGFPPYRTGGLTKLAVDLMHEQAKAGHTVCALWPGKISLIGRDVRIVHRGKTGDIDSYELVNPVPVSLDKGILEPERFIATKRHPVYDKFFRELAPDVIHVHTLMGLHEAFFTAAKRYGIRMVYTTHDYFGICLKAYLYTNRSTCGTCGKGMNCMQCNMDGLSYKKIVLLQSPLYRTLKDAPLVRMARKKYLGKKSNIKMKDNALDADETEEIRRRAEQYSILIRYYRRLFSYIDFFHFNSSTAKKIYTDIIPGLKGKVITITHADIADRRKERTYSDACIRYTMLAPAKVHKGFDVVRKAMNELWQEGKRNFSLTLYTEPDRVEPYMNIHRHGYSYGDLEKIFDETDVLLVPSVWYETFGFTVLEAISYGVPVIVTDHVGARDIMGEGGAVISAGSYLELKYLLETLDAKQLQTWNAAVLAIDGIKTMPKLAEEIEEIYNCPKGEEKV